MEMESAPFCAFSHLKADVFTVLGSLSRTLQVNDLILPKATAELERTGGCDSFVSDEVCPLPSP